MREAKAKRLTAENAKIAWIVFQLYVHFVCYA